MSFRSLSIAAVTFVRSLAASRRGRRATAAIPLLVLAAAFPGCGRHVTGAFIPNRPPELEILDARAQPANPGEVRVRWAARDEDGSVVRTVWTLAPLRSAPGGPNTIAAAQATATAARECVLARNAPVKGARLGSAARPEPDLFTIWAVDDRGAESEHKRLALFDGNVAPIVTITCPVPNPLVTIQLPPQVSFAWTGTDPDGIFTTRPVKYKYKLLQRGNTEFDIDYARFDPDSLRRYYAARNFAGWDSTSGDTTSVTFTNLTPSQTYLFVVTGFDEAGDYDPVFNFSKNMLAFQVGLATVLGPRLAMWNSELSYFYSTGGWSTDPSRIVSVEEPAGVPLAFNVVGTPAVGGAMAGYRWALDPADPHDPTVRSDPNDRAHWSEWSLQTRIDLGAFSPPGNKRESHTLYIEASSLPAGCTGPPGTGFISLGIIRFIVVRGTYSQELLIVDDTRLEVDQFLNGTRKPYGQGWPARAELDTFLFARGGFPWRGTVNPPTGAISAPGLFAGYSFDTLGTRGVFSGPAHNGVPTGSVPLSTLADYRHVIWMVDHNGGYYTSVPTNPLQPTSALHYMCTPGRLNGFAEYVALGGRVWLLGGAAAVASLREYNAVGADNNDRDYSPINGFVFAGPGYAHHEGKDELTPGRPMYDAAHWRSLMISQLTTARINRSSSLTTFPDARWLDQPGYAFVNPVHRPDYMQLPATMHARTNPASDPVNGEPIPPTRAASYTIWWTTTAIIDAEYLLQPNIIVEDMNPDPAVESWGVALDTLMSAQGTGLVAGGLGYEPAAMTWYHGVESPEFVFTGFPIWAWRRADCQQLVDFVLQQIWHMEKHTGPATPLARRSAVASSRAAPAAERVHLPAWGSANR